MPELPEVQTVVSTLQPLVGRRLGRAQVLKADVLRGEPVDFNTFTRRRTIRNIRRAAKRIVIELGADREVMIHLGMTGQLVVKERSEPLLPHTHLRIALSGGNDELRFRDVRRFGGVWLLTRSTPRTGRGLGPLGPDPLEIDLTQFRHMLKRNRQVKALLLDQTIIGGLGNIYADESLYKARVHPLSRAAALKDDQVRQLFNSVRRTLCAAIKAGGSTISDYRNPNGERGWFQFKHQAYGREGKPCRRCKTAIKRIIAAGRSSHICPTCQRKRG